MNTLDAVMNRRSVRKYQDKKVPEDVVKKLLQAAMAGPSAVNARPWQFIVVDDRETLDKMADANGRAAQLLKSAPLAILLCGDLDKAFEKAKDYWIVDLGIASQNMVIAAEELGLGSVDLGTWPQEEKLAGQKAIFGLPDNVVPFLIIAFGYPEEGFERAPRADRPEFDESSVHYNKW